MFSTQPIFDHAVAMANVRRPAEFWDLLSRHIQACTLVDNWNASIQRVLVNISHRVLQMERPAPELRVEPSVEACVPQWTPLPSLAQLPSGAVRWYGDYLVRSWSVGGGMFFQGPLGLSFGYLIFNCLLITRVRLEKQGQ